MRSGFYDNIRLSDRDLADLKEVVKLSHTTPWIFQSIDGLYNSQTAKLCGIYVNGSIASFAWHMKRTWILGGKSFNGLSIGIVTTLPLFRNLGYAQELIVGIELLARQENMDFLYLAGIPNFYTKYGFKGFAPKSKLVFRVEDIPKQEGTIRHATIDDLKFAYQMHASYSRAISSFSARSYLEWEDLFGALSSTFLFNCPKIVLDGTKRPVAYFCDTPGNEIMIREFVTPLDSVLTTTALAIVANDAARTGQEKLEIFCPSSGPIWDLAANVLGADYHCFLRPKASNMMKWISKDKPLEDFYCDFFFQGDML